MKFKIFLIIILISSFFSTSFASFERTNSMGKAIWLMDDLLYDLDLNPAFATSQKRYFLNSSFFFYKKEVKGPIYYPMDTFSQSRTGKKDSLQVKVLTVIPIRNSLSLVLGGEFERIDHSIRFLSSGNIEKRLLQSMNRVYSIRTALAYNLNPNLSLGVDFQLFKKPQIDSFNKKQWTGLSPNPISFDQVEGKKITLGIKNNINRIEYGFSLSYLWQEQNFWQESISWTGNFVKTTFKERFKIWQGISHLKYQISKPSYLRAYLGFFDERFELKRSTLWSTEKVKESTKFPSPFWGLGLFNCTGGATVVFGFSGRYFEYESNADYSPFVSYQVFKYSLHFGVEHTLFQKLKLRGGVFLWFETTEREKGRTVAAFAGSYFSSQSNVLEPSFLTLGLGIKVLKNLDLDIDFANIPKSSDSEAKPFLKISTSFTY